MRPRSSGWPTLPVSSCIRIPCARTISIIPMSCGSISIRFPASRGRRSARSHRSLRATLQDFGLIGWPKTSGSRGIHVNVRIERRWTFDEVRRAALALAREVERRAPELATSKWWKEERHGVFLDYNQNAKDRTVAAAYSVRPTPDARVSAPLTWEEIASASRAISRSRRCPSASRNRRPPRGDRRHPCSLEQRSRAVRATGARRSRRRALAAALPEAARRAGARAAVTAAQPSRPLVEIGRAQRKADALAGLERWKERHPEAAAHLEPADVLVDAMRGGFIPGRGSV